MLRTTRVIMTGSIKEFRYNPIPAFYAHESITQLVLFMLGVLLLSLGLQGLIEAQGLVTTYNDARIAESVNVILTYLEGSFGALVMVSAGVGAILSAAFGQYRAALGLLVVAVGAFILRSLIATFFNDISLQP